MTNKCTCWRVLKKRTLADRYEEHELRFESSKTFSTVMNDSMDALHFFHDESGMHAAGRVTIASEKENCVMRNKVRLKAGERWWQLWNCCWLLGVLVLDCESRDSLQCLAKQRVSKESEQANAKVKGVGGVLNVKVTANKWKQRKLRSTLAMNCEGDADDKKKDDKWSCDWADAELFKERALFVCFQKQKEKSKCGMDASATKPKPNAHSK